MHRKEKQRRQDFRAKISYPIWYRLFVEIGVKPQWQKTVTNDLSAGGTSFGAGISGESATPKPGEFLEIRLFLPERPLFLMGKVVRENVDDFGGAIVAVSFSSLGSADEDYIARVALSGGLERRYGKSN